MARHPQLRIAGFAIGDNRSGHIWALFVDPALHGQGYDFAVRALPGEFVTTDTGTGIVHIAPAFGEDDYALGRAEGLLFLQPVGLDGRFSAGPWAGQFVKEADRDIRRDLRSRGVLLRDEQIQHTYPFCWRCDTPVLYYAKPSWYIRTTAVARKMVANNRDIHWVPEHIQEGRFVALAVTAGAVGVAWHRHRLETAEQVRRHQIARQDQSDGQRQLIALLMEIRDAIRAEAAGPGTHSRRSKVPNSASGTATRTDGIRRNTSSAPAGKSVPASASTRVGSAGAPGADASSRR